MIRLRVLLSVAVAVSVVGVTGPAGAATTAPTRELTWMSTGDSYSSGEGTTGNSGACALSERAWGPRAARVLRERDPAWEIAPVVHTACTGHLVGDFFIRRERGFLTRLRGTPQKGSFREWAVELTGDSDPQFDVITISMGGNDLGFGDVVKDCNVWLEVPNGLSFGGILGGIPGLGGCDVGEDELLGQVRAMADEDRFTIDDGGDGGTGEAVRGSLGTYYRLLAEQHLRPGGVLVVLGYPRLFAPSGEWRARYGTRCGGFNRGDANMLGRVAEEFDRVMAAEAAEADAAAPDRRITFVSALDLFGGRDGQRAAEDGHELCGNGPDWLNGFSLDSSGSFVDASFHPNDDGHLAEAGAVADVVAAHAFPTADRTTTAGPTDEAGVEFLGPASSVYDEEYSADVVDVSLDGRILRVGFEAAGRSDLRDPLDTCLRIEGQGLDWTSAAIGADLTVDEPGRYAGTLSFPALVTGTYSFNYSCRSDYSSPAIAEVAMPSIAISRHSSDYYAAVFGVDGAGLRFAAHGTWAEEALRLPATSCVHRGDGATEDAADVDLTASWTTDGIGHYYEGTLRFAGPLAGASFQYSCSTYTIVPLDGSAAAAGSGWPTGASDGSPAFFAYLGASFVAPSWTSCSADYCLAGADGRVYAYDVRDGITELGSIDADVADPSTVLLDAGIPADQVDELLRD